MDVNLQYTDTDRCQSSFGLGLISQYISISQACYQAASGQPVCASQAFRQARIHISPALCQRNWSRNLDRFKPSFRLALIYLCISVKR